MKQTYLLSAFFGYSYLRPAQAQVKIGYANPSVVLAQLDEGAFVDNKLNNLFKIEMPN